MRAISILPLFALIVVSCASLNHRHPAPLKEPVGTKSAETTPKKKDLPSAVVMLRATHQAHSFIQPWRKKAPGTAFGQSTHIGSNRYLTASHLVRNHTVLQLEDMKSRKRTSAKVLAVDYKVGLALIQADEASFSAGREAFPVAGKSNPEGKVSAAAFQNGNTVKMSGKYIRAYAQSGLLFTEFSISVPHYLKVVNGGPIIADSKLAGLVIGHTKGATKAIPALVIRKFLEGGEKKLPSVGFSYSSVDAPRMREYLKLPEDKTGVYVHDVIPAYQTKDGLREGDVLLRIDGSTLSRSGHYKDPEFGLLPLNCLLRSRSHVGQVRELTVWRDGAEEVVPMTMRSLTDREVGVAGEIADRGPDYIIVGGFVIQELSKQLLMEWGNWQKKAPTDLVEIYNNRWDWAKSGRAPVILTYVLPVPGVHGYQQLRFKIIEKVNGEEIKKLSDVAAALAKPQVLGGERSHRFEFRRAPKVVILGTSQIPRDEMIIRRRFRIPELRRLTNE